MNMKDYTPEEIQSAIETTSNVMRTMKVSKTERNLSDKDKEHNREIRKELRPLQTTADTLTKAGMEVPENITADIERLQSKLVESEPIVHVPTEEDTEEAMNSLLEIVSLHELLQKAASKMNNELKFQLKKTEE